MKPWIVYTLIRIALFAAALTILLIVGVTNWIAAIVAAIIALCVSYLFFRPQRDAVATKLYEARASAREDDASTGSVSGADEAAEDR